MFPKFLSFFSFFLFLLPHLNLADSANETCPFSDDCLCHNSNPPPDMFTIETVYCEPSSHGMPSYIFSPRFYKITNRMTIKSMVQNISRDAFYIFRRIGKLSLLHTGPGQGENANWDNDAFSDIEIAELHVTKLRIFPLPRSLQKLTNLKSISLSDCSRYIQIGEKEFQYFPDLRSISIDRTPIYTIDGDAFLSLNNLTSISFTSTSLAIFPFVVYSVPSLKKLRLSDPNMANFPQSAFLPLENLEVLDLSGIGLGSAFVFGLFTSLPSKLKILVLRNCGIGMITRYVFSGKIPDGLDLLDLSQNSMGTIENGVMRNMSVEILDLSQSEVQSIDISNFGEMTKLGKLLMENNLVLKSVNVSDLESIHWPTTTNTTFILTNTSLETISPLIDFLMEKYPNLEIHIDSTDQMICTEGIAWMAKRICAGTLTFQNVYCNGTNTTLDQYLHEIVPEYDCGSSTAFISTESLTSLSFSTLKVRSTDSESVATESTVFVPTESSASIGPSASSAGTTESGSGTTPTTLTSKGPAKNSGFTVLAAIVSLGLFFSF